MTEKGYWKDKVYILNTYMGTAGMNFVCHWCRNAFALYTNMYMEKGIDSHLCPGRDGEQVFVMNGVQICGVAEYNRAEKNSK